MQRGFGALLAACCLIFSNGCLAALDIDLSRVPWLMRVGETQELRLFYDYHGVSVEPLRQQGSVYIFIQYRQPRLFQDQAAGLKETYSLVQENIYFDCRRRAFVVHEMNLFSHETGEIFHQVIPNSEYPIKPGSLMASLHDHLCNNIPIDGRYPVRKIGRGERVPS